MSIADSHYRQALESLHATLAKLHGCSPHEKAALQHEWSELESMQEKLTQGRVEIVVFGEISTGKSALINALIGHEVTSVNVQGGWTKRIGRNTWDSAGYSIPGLSESQVVLIDTPGLNEVGGGDRATMAKEAARSADLILFVTDSDLNEIEYSSLLALKSVNKPLIFVLNKIDLYSRAEQTRLQEILRDERLTDIIEPADFVITKADPREVERIRETASGEHISEWIKPPPDVTQLKARILEVLEEAGLSLLALNAAMYASDHSDKIASLRLKLRNSQAETVIWSYASFNAIAVGCTPVGITDIIVGATADALMVVTLANVYGMSMSWMHARSLVVAIFRATGWTMVGLYASSLFKFVTGGWGTVLTAVPQGAAAGYGTYIVGQAAKFYFEHGSSWGADGPKQVVQNILSETDRDSVIEKLKTEINKKLRWNKHAETSN